MTKDYGKLYREYLDLKLNTQFKRNEIIDNINEWFEENHPTPGLSIYVNGRVMIDQLCLIFTCKLSGEVLKHFCDTFGLEIYTEMYTIRREHGRTMVVGNPHIDFEKWKYSFKLKG